MYLCFRRAIKVWAQLERVSNHSIVILLAAIWEQILDGLIFQKESVEHLIQPSLTALFIYTPSWLAFWNDIYIRSKTKSQRHGEVLNTSSLSLQLYFREGMDQKLLEINQVVAWSYLDTLRQENDRPADFPSVRQWRSSTTWGKGIVILKGSPQLAYLGL